MKKAVFSKDYNYTFLSLSFMGRYIFCSANWSVKR